MQIPDGRAEWRPFCRAYREVPSAELAEIFCKEGCKDVGNSDNIEEAFHMAHEAKGEDGMLFCVGSLYLVGEIKTLLLKK